MASPNQVHPRVLPGDGESTYRSMSRVPYRTRLYASGSPACCSASPKKPRKVASWVTLNAVPGTDRQGRRQPAGKNLSPRQSFVAFWYGFLIIKQPLFPSEVLVPRGAVWRVPIQHYSNAQYATSLSISRQ